MWVSPRFPDREAEAVCGDWGTAGRVGLGVAPTVTAVTGGPRLLGGWGGHWGLANPRVAVAVLPVTGGLRFRKFHRRRKW